MSWRDELRPGSFRGAAFFIAGADTTAGRRTVLHEYPLRDTPFAEDLGRKGREFMVDCYVLGPGYMSARDALVEALEAEGSGTLVHPYLGELRVAVMSSRWRESPQDGGVARFAIQFAEAGENLQPTAAPATGALVDAAADDAIEAAEETFAEEVDLDSQPQWVFDAALDLLSRALASIGDLSASLRGLPAEVAGFDRMLSGVAGELDSLMQSPEALAGKFTPLLRDLRGLVHAPDGALRVLGELFYFAPGIASTPSLGITSGIASATSSRIRQGDNQRAIVGLVRRAALIEAVRAASEVGFKSYDEAVEVRNALSAEIDRHLDAAGDREYAALTDLKVAMVRDINARGADLARVLVIVPPATLPALALSHRLYGDTAAADDIVARNRVRHPGFVPGGRALQALTRA